MTPRGLILADNPPVSGNSSGPSYGLPWMFLSLVSVSIIWSLFGTHILRMDSTTMGNDMTRLNKYFFLNQRETVTI